jgi:hypothetical protein
MLQCTPSKIIIKNIFKKIHRIQRKNKYINTQKKKHEYIPSNYGYDIVHFSNNKSMKR